MLQPGGGISLVCNRSRRAHGTHGSFGGDFVHTGVGNPSRTVRGDAPFLPGIVMGIGPHTPSVVRDRQSESTDMS